MTQLTKVTLRRVELSTLIAEDAELRTSAFLHSIKSKDVRALLESATVHRAAAGSTIFAQGDFGQGLMFVVRGRVRLASSAQRELVDVALLGKGDVFGEHEALRECGARCYSAVAVEESDLVEIPRTLVQQLVKTDLPFRELLERLDHSRRAHVDEMAEFLNRW